MQGAMRKILVIPFAAAAALAGCANGQSGASQTSANASLVALAGPVTYDMSSWGQLLLRWQVNPGGDGEIWKGEGLGKGRSAVRKYRMQLPPAALAEFKSKSDALKAATARGIECRREISDMPYGSITWDFRDDRASYRFDGGCKSAAADAALGQLRALSELVESKAAIEPTPFATTNPAAPD